MTRLDVEAAFIPNAFEDMATNVVATPTPNGKGWTVKGDSTLGTDIVATFSRLLYQNERHEVIIRHTRIDVDPYFQWQGYAKSLLSANMPLKRLAVSNREIHMRLYLKQQRPLAVLKRRGIL